MMIVNVMKNHFFRMTSLSLLNKKYVLNHFFPIFNIVLNNGGNDSMAFKTSYYDFRGEKGRDKALDISPKRFNTTTFMTTKERVEHAEKISKDGLFQERNHQK